MEKQRSGELKREIARRDGGCFFCQAGYFPPYIRSETALHEHKNNYVLMCNWHERMWDEDWFDRRIDMTLLLDRHFYKERVKWRLSGKAQAM